MLDSLRRWLARRPEAESAPSRLPDGMRVYAVGDVHGRADCLEEIGALIEAHAAANPIGECRLVLLGDVIDRGPDSAAVVERLCHPPLCAGMSQEVLLGNHEFLMLQFLETPSVGRSWLPLGGLATLASYGVDCLGALTDDRLSEMRRSLAEKLPALHRRFLEQRPPSLEIGDYLFVHAGVRPGIPLARQRIEDFLWIREPFLSAAKPIAGAVVHGHSVVAAPELLAGRIGIDTGAYHGGVLTCLVLEGETRSLLQTRPDSVRRAALRPR